MKLDIVILDTKPYGEIAVTVEHVGNIWRVKHENEVIAEALTRDEALKIAASPRFVVKQQRRGAKGLEYTVFIAETLNETVISVAPSLKECIKEAESYGYRLV